MSNPIPVLESCELSTGDRRMHIPMGWQRWRDLWVRNIFNGRADINHFLRTKVVVFLMVLSYHFVHYTTAYSQDMAQLAMHARNNLYDHWNFDSVEFYFDKIIGKKYTPAFAYSDYGWYLMLKKRSNEGIKYIRQAAEMDSSDKQLVTWYSWALLWDGDLEKSIEWINKALSIDPSYGEALHLYSRIASKMGDHHSAIILAEKAAKNDVNWRGIIPLALALSGNREQALIEAENIDQNANVFDFWFLMEVHATLGNVDRSLEYLVKAYEQRYPFFPWLGIAPGLEHVRDHPKFKQIVEKLQIP